MISENEKLEETKKIQARLNIEKYWRLPWADLEIMLGFRTALGIRNLAITTPDRAEEFLKNSGFDLDMSSNRKSFEQFYFESLFFIRHVLLGFDERNKYVLPPKLLYLQDPRFLFVYASDMAPRARYVRLWACAIIKVFYAIANLEYSDKLKDMNIAREQILGRVKSLISIDHSGNSKIEFNGLSLNLQALDWKDSKTRTSMILKLLHKPESAADEVFDYFGVRFVLNRECDLPILLKILLEADIVLPSQLLVQRTRNSLFNLEKAKKFADMLYGLSSMGLVESDDLEKYLKNIPWVYKASDELPKSRNPASSAEYRSLQLTVRHLVHLPNLAHPIIESLTQQLRHFRGIDSDEPSFLSLIPAESARYFPLEIQIMDAASYDLSKFGAASHEQYKAQQLKLVREKVLSSILNFSEEKFSTQEGI